MSERPATTTDRIRDLHTYAVAWDMSPDDRYEHIRDHNRAQFDHWLEPYTAQVRAEVAEQIATDLKNTRVICPNHKMPDCSPLLNGCALPGIMFACYRDAARIAREHGGTP